MSGIRKIIQQLADTGDEVYAKVALVYQINEQERTCDVSPLDGSAHVYDVRLQATPQLSDGFVVFPKLNSQVLIVFLNQHQAFVAACSEVDRVELRGSGLGGLVKIEELKRQLDINTKRIDAALDILKNSVQNCALHPSPAWTATISPIIDALQKEDYSDIENDKVKHG